MKEKTSIRLFIENYNSLGYDILIVSWYHSRYGHYADKHIYYTFCPTGCIKKTTTHMHDLWSDLEMCKQAVNEYATNTLMLLTNKQYKDWVSTPNRKNQWGYSRNDLEEITKKYLKSDPIRRFGYEEQMTDANFHSFCDVLMTGDEKQIRDYLEGYVPYWKTYECTIKRPDKPIENTLKDTIKEEIEALMRDKYDINLSIEFA